jgi:uncharacterized protein YuzE
MDGHYDRDADIAWIRFEGWNPDDVSVEEFERGLVERSKTTGRTVGLEFWSASGQLPTELLDALPQPPARQTVVERQPS